MVWWEREGKVNRARPEVVTTKEHFQKQMKRVEEGTWEGEYAQGVSVKEVLSWDGLLERPGAGAEWDGNVVQAVWWHMERQQCSIDGCSDLQALDLHAYSEYREFVGRNVPFYGGMDQVVGLLSADLQAPAQVCHMSHALLAT